MTDNLLLLVLLTGILFPAVLFFRERRGRIEYIVFGTGVLIILGTLAILTLEQRSEDPQTALDSDQELGAPALLLPSTSTETQAPVSSTSTPERPAASATATAPVAAGTAGARASTPVAVGTVGATRDAPTSRPTEDEAPGASPEALISTVRVGTANVRREPAANSPVVGTVALNDELVVLDSLNGWYQVQLGERHAPRSRLEGGQGWIWGELINAP